LLTLAPATNLSLGDGFLTHPVKQRATLSRLGVETASNSFHLGV
jgi:hypothetical protein